MERQDPTISPLPTLHDRPDADVVIYDGACRFCTSQVERIAHWDGAGRLAFVSLHNSEVVRRYPDLTPEQLMEQVYVFDQLGNRYGGAAAFRYLSRRLPRLWYLAPLLHIPFSLPLWQWAYAKIARRRYTLKGSGSCDDQACKMHFE